MQYRPIKGGLADSMNECVSLEPTIEALRGHLSAELCEFDSESLEVKEYNNNPDDRIGWEKTFLVTVKRNSGEVSPVGMTNQAIEYLREDT